MPPIVAEKKIYTYADYLGTPDDERYELVEGDLVMTPSPVPGHQRISRKIQFFLDRHVTENDLGEIFNAPCDVYLDDKNVVQPDILFITKNRMEIIGEKNIQGAPDLVIEIISESSAYRDMVHKKKIYAEFGVKEYWIVVPESESVEVYVLKGKLYQIFGVYFKKDSLESPYLNNFKMPLKDVF